MVTVEIQDGQAASAAKLAADDAERERKKRQNALPAWHQSSTIVTAASASDGKQIRVDVTAAAALDIVEDSSATKATVNVVSSTVMSAAGDDETSTPAASTVVAGEEEEGADIMGYYDNYYASYVEENEDDEDEFVEVDMPEQGAEAVSVAPPEKQSALDMPSAAPETAADTFEDDEEDDEFIDVELPADGIAPKRKHDDDDDAEKDVATSARDTKRMKTASADQ